MAETSSSRLSSTANGSPTRDVYIDFLRAFSLLVVVAWHWVFTIIIWQDDGPHATSPIGFTTGLWTATWLLQVMPLFFYVGGYSHLVSWRKAHANGDNIWRFVLRRIRRLAVPTLALLGIWVAGGIALGVIFNLEWIGRAVLLVVSPLWFMGVYLMLVALLPVFIWLHERWDSIVLVFLVAAAGTVDILRFRYGWEWLGIVNMITVWALCHQLGFFYERVVTAERRSDWTLLWSGLAALGGLVASGLYPGSMVGVPGETSNMAPPTLCIVALVIFQAGVAEILRPAMEIRLQRIRWQRVNDTINRFSMPLFLFHTTGLAAYLAVRYALAGERNEIREPTVTWWLFRPLAFVGPLLFTLPVIYLFGRQWVRHPRTKPSAPAGDRTAQTV